MPLPTPFYDKIAPLCQSGEWRNWSGYLAPVTYEFSHEFEYYAIRNSAGLLDVTPLYKYEITGPDAALLVDRIVTRDMTKCKIGQVMYTTWCDEQGKMVDDGTVQRLGENDFRITSTDPSFRWFSMCAVGLDTKIVEVTGSMAALALQGPTSRDILKQCTTGADLDALKFFYLAEAEMDNVPVLITRTGYTGDLGYEIWMDNAHAGKVWQTLMEAGKGYGITPIGLAALDIARIEATLLLKEVDYTSTLNALIEARKSSPFEAGLGWAVKLKGGDFVGRRILLHEKENPSEWRFVGMEVDWPSLEQRFAEVDLPPHIAGRASRMSVPLYKNKRQIGYATSSTFSPILKKFIAIGTIEAAYAEPGIEIDFEITVEFVRKLVPATIAKTPFYNPPWKRA